MATLARIKAEAEEAVERAEAFDFTRQQIELIKHSVLKGGSDLELDLFLNWCRTKGLDPLSGEAYAVRQGGGIQPAAQIAGLRKIAARTGLYGPQDGPYWCGADGEWTDVWLQGEHPLAARVGVKQIGHDAYTYSVAHWNEHGKTKAGRGGPWATQPAHMLAIRAEAAALRRVFPTELGGVYIKDELEQDEQPRRREMKPLQPKVGAATIAELREAEPEQVEMDTGRIDTDTGEIIDGETREIRDHVFDAITTEDEAERIVSDEAHRNVLDEIDDLAAQLNLKPSDVAKFAKTIKANYTTPTGAIQLRSALLGMLPDEPSGEAGNDRHTG